jgi:hypothetical protein
MIIRAMAILLCTFMSIVFIWLGYSHATDGLGLNPWISIPLAFVFYSLPLYVFIFDTEWVEDDDD